jgi:hypothetical protein
MSYSFVRGNAIMEQFERGISLFTEGSATVPNPRCLRQTEVMHVVHATIDPIGQLYSTVSNVLAYVI